MTISIYLDLDFNFNFDIFTNLPHSYLPQIHILIYPKSPPRESPSSPQELDHQQSTHTDKITICVRKRPISNKEVKMLKNSINITERTEKSK